MRSLNRRFNIKKETNPHLGDIILLAISVKHQNFSKRVIQSSFDICIDRNEYDATDRKALLHFLYKITSRAEDDIK